jgi:hypothetical protein
MPDGDAIVDALAANENRYLLVRPGGGLRGDWEVVNVWNGDIKFRGEKDECTGYAKDVAEHSQSFDYVLEVRDPEVSDDE